MVVLCLSIFHREKLNFIVKENVSKIHKNIQTFLFTETLVYIRRPLKPLSSMISRSLLLSFLSPCSALLELSF